MIKLFEKSERVLAQEVNNSKHKNGKDIFPQEFYNYTDIYRLWRLINIRL